MEPTEQHREKLLAAALIETAHPAVRDQLRSEAREPGCI